MLRELSKFIKKLKTIPCKWPGSDVLRLFISACASTQIIAVSGRPLRAPATDPTPMLWSPPNVRTSLSCRACSCVTSYSMRLACPTILARFVEPCAAPSAKSSCRPRPLRISKSKSPRSSTLQASLSSRCTKPRLRIKVGPRSTPKSGCPSARGAPTIVTFRGSTTYLEKSVAGRGRGPETVASSLRLKIGLADMRLVKKCCTCGINVSLRPRSTMCQYCISFQVTVFYFNTSASFLFLDEAFFDGYMPCKCYMVCCFLLCVVQKESGFSLDAQGAPRFHVLSPRSSTRSLLLPQSRASRPLRPHRAANNLWCSPPSSPPRVPGRPSSSQAGTTSPPPHCRRALADSR